jgi:hypothetical protein
MRRIWLPALTLPFLAPLLAPPSQAATAPVPAFDTPVISGIQGYGFEQSMRVAGDGTVYASVPNSLASATSFIWRSLDGGETFKWVPGVAPLTGKPLGCAGGGDTELAVDETGSLYFIDLTLVNYSTMRSDDKGQTFTPPQCTAVTSSPVDRQWYAVDGDPKNGGALYLASNEVAEGQPDPTCAENNRLVLFRSPVDGVGPLAGVSFGPPHRISAPCDEGIMGNVEVSPTTKHIFIPHDDNSFDSILVARCEKVPFTTDPSGTTCVDKPVTTFPGFKTAGLFPTLAIDKAGTLYVLWQQAPVTGTYDELTDTDNRVVTGDTTLWMSRSTDEGDTWTAPKQVPTPGLHHNVYSWLAGGDAGRVGLAWYGTTSTSEPGTAPDGNTQQPQVVSGPDNVQGVWNLYYSTTLDGGSTWTAPVVASDHLVRKGPLFTFLGGGNQSGGRRALGDFINLRLGTQGEAVISYGDGTNVVGDLLPHAMIAHQNSGPSLLASVGEVKRPARLVGGATDPKGDATLDAASVVGPNQPNLDLLSSSMVKTADGYRITMTVDDLGSLTPGAQAGGTTLVWSTQWKVVSDTAPNGGATFHAYMESVAGQAPTFHVGQNAAQLNGGGAIVTYPGSATVPGQYNADAGIITIDVPASATAVEGAKPVLHSVTSSTHTLEAAADSAPSLGGIGGMPFNLVDVVQPYGVGGAVVVTPEEPEEPRDPPPAVPPPPPGGPAVPAVPRHPATGAPYAVMVLAAACAAVAATLRRRRSV